MSVTDKLLVDGLDLLDRPARERAEGLAHVAPVWLVRWMVTAAPELAAALILEALARGQDGVMAKSL